MQVGASSVVPVRWLNLQEFQSKKLMADNGLHVQRFKVAENAKEAVEIAKELSEWKVFFFIYVIYVFCNNNNVTRESE